MKKTFLAFTLIGVIVLIGAVTFAQKNKPAIAPWVGKWVSTDEYETVVISTSENSIGASFNYKATDRSGSGKWTDCKVRGGVLKCKWTADHDDATKTAKRQGTLKATLKGDALSVIYYEAETENMNWKPGYGPHVFDGSIGAGAIHERNYKRKTEDQAASDLRAIATVITKISFGDGRRKSLTSPELRISRATWAINISLLTQ